MRIIVSTDFSEQLTHVTALEARIIALSSDEPLAMGALGSALVEIQPASPPDTTR